MALATAVAGSDELNPSELSGMLTAFRKGARRLTGRLLQPHAPDGAGREFGKELVGVDAQGAAELQDREKSRVAFAALDTAHMIDMDARELGELLLGEAALLA